MWVLAVTSTEVGDLTLVGAMVVAIGFLSKLLLDYIADLKAQRDRAIVATERATDLADRATQVSSDAVAENRRMADAIEARNRFEEMQLKAMQR